MPAEIREVLLSFSISLLKIAFLSFWDLLLSYNMHVVLMEDDRAPCCLGYGDRFRGEQVTQARSVTSSVYYFLMGVATLRLQSRISLHNRPLPHGGTCLRGKKVRKGEQRQIEVLWKSSGC